MKHIIHIERDIDTPDDFEELIKDIYTSLVNITKELDIDPRIYTSAVLVHAFAALYWYMGRNEIEFKRYLNILGDSYLSREKNEQTQNSLGKP